MKYAIIAGTGFENLLDGNILDINTKYGKEEIFLIEKFGIEIAVLNRHGRGPKKSPSVINYRSIATALHSLGIKYVYGICAVGSLKKELVPGSIVLQNDFLDMTKNRITSFFIDGEVRHLEVSEVYSPDMRQIFYEISKNTFDVQNGGIYVCTEGPRFESAAEISLYKMLNCDIVGMTNIPEVLLFNELGINYAAISYVTNFCTSIDGTIDESDFKSLNFDKKKLLDLVSKSFLHDSFNNDSILNNSTLL